MKSSFPLFPTCIIFLIVPFYTNGANILFQVWVWINFLVQLHSFFPRIIRNEWAPLLHYFILKISIFILYLLEAQHPHTKLLLQKTFISNQNLKQQKTCQIDYNQYSFHIKSHLFLLLSSTKMKSVKGKHKKPSTKHPYLQEMGRINLEDSE